jgi:HAMP domain-containing protein
MPDRTELDTLLVAMVNLSAAHIDLAEYARDLAADPTSTLSPHNETLELIAHALATAIDARSDTSDEVGQLRGALARFLEGWAP